METSQKTNTVNVFLDANIWIDYAWCRYMPCEEGENRICTKIIKRIDALKERSPYMIIFSPYIIAEISHHFTDWFLLKRTISDGFGYREFNRERKNHQIRDEEKELIDRIIQDIGSKVSVNILEIESLEKKDIENILNLRSNYIDFYDSFHIHTALKKNCRYFVTKDSELRKRFQEMISEGVINKNVEILTDKGFLEIIESSTGK
jgi:predicted nucleic acid-binding protein